MKKTILLLLLLLSTASFAEYKEFKTKYFDFIYQENIKEQVIDLIKKSDNIADKEFKFYGFEPTKKYIIRILDNVDYENSFTGLSSIVLYLNVPRSNEIEKNYSNWLEYVFTHELTHLILNNKVNGLFKYVWGFGNVLQNLLIPTWMQEGLAVYSETKFTDGGRGISDRFNMVIKSKYNDEKFKGLSLAGNYNYKGENSYVYGYSFISFFAETYGEKKLTAAVDYFTHHQLKPAYLLFAKIAGVSGKELNKEWKLYLKKKYSLKKDLVEGNKILKIADNKSNLKVDNGKLYFQGYYKDTILNEKYVGGVFSLNVKTKKLKQEIKDGISGSFGVKDGEIYYSKLKTNVLEDKIENVSYEEKGWKHRYLLLDRGINFLKLPNDLVYVQREKGYESLKVLGGEKLISENKRFQFGKLFYSNGKIYFDASKKGEKGNFIYSLDMKNMKLEKITEGIAPFYDNKNKKLYFAKDINGIYEIVSLDIKTGDEKQITNVNYGAFEPVIYNENLYYLNFYSKGYYIYKLNKKDFVNKNLSEKELKTVANLVKKEDIKLKGKLKLKEKLELKDKNFKNGLSLANGIILPGMINLSFVDKLDREYYNISAYYFKNENEEVKTGVALNYNYKLAGFPVFGLDLQVGDFNYYGVRISLPLYLRRLKQDSYLNFRYSSEDMAYGLGFGRFNLNQTISEGIPLNNLTYKDEHLELSYYWSKFIQEIDEPIFNNNIYRINEEDSVQPEVKINSNKLLKFNLNFQKDILIEKGDLTGGISLDKIYLRVENMYLKEYLWGTQSDILKCETGIDFYMTYYAESRIGGGVYYYINDLDNVNFDNKTPYFYFKFMF
ncbi:hypothetical protein [Haliovirga abyssi]|uniref:Uncharacterized protein n=1 Tax=Haliovirga abyssi TaxID=2996794 RepID=A0AAU9DXY0_9FUSO|nr:hypothetical protein [Haliovirga abyssi]BDU51361.1 hypothetical protein HLVA_19300 [Haliovirga abyssi]